MRRAFWIMVMLVIIITGGWSQEAGELLKTYKRNFAIASLDVKIHILEDASGMDSQEMGPLYLQALDYVLDNFSLIPTDQRFRQLSVVALNQIGNLAYTDARHSVWKIFEMDSETTVRANAMNALGVIGKGDEDIIQNINHWLESQNNIFQTGKIPDLQVIIATVTALGQIGDQSSFPILFSAMNLGYSGDITRQARGALLMTQGDLKDHLLVVIKTRTLPEKKEALIMAVESDRLDDDKKGEVAEFALDVGLHTAASDTLLKATAREIRSIANRALSERRWSKATPLVIEHFDNALLEYDRGISSKGFLLEAIAGLGNMGTHEAAVRLTQYLVLLNSYTEKGLGFDEQIMLAVTSSLGKLGDKTAFDDLLYAQYLNYNAPVKKAAREALENLKW